MRPATTRSIWEVGNGRSQGDERRLGLSSDDPGDGADLRVGQLARTQGLADTRVLQQRPPDAHLVLGGAHTDAAVPVQPEGGAATFPALIALAPVELTEQKQPSTHPRSQMGGAFTDLRFEALERYLGRRHDLFRHTIHYTKRMFDPPAFAGLHRSGHRFPA